MADLRFALRQLFKHPGFTTVAILPLALGIGACSTVFTLIQGVLLTPPPYPKPNELVLITPARTDGRPNNDGWPSAQWREWQTESKSLAAVAGYGWTFNFLISPDGSESIEGMVVTPDYFKVIGLQPMIGRAFAESDAGPGRPETMILGHEFWQRRFRGDPNIVGQTVRISRHRQPITVIGVMPPGTRFLPSPSEAQEPNYNVNAKVDYWLPVGPDPNRANRPDWNIVARLNPGVTTAAAQAELTTMTQREAVSEPTFAGIQPNLQLLEDFLNRDGQRLLLPVAGAVLLVFAIACANAAGLLLARGLQRQHDYAVRSALGARPMQLCRPILIESTLLALLGGVLGIALAALCVDGLRIMAGSAIPRLDSVRLGWPVLLFCLGTSGLAGLLAGLFPAWRSLSRDPADALKAGGRTASLGRTERRLMSGVATVQIALTLALLVGASLLIQTVRTLANVRPGYETQHVLTMSVTAVGSNWFQFHTRAVERVTQLPGVRAAAFGWGVPLTGNKWMATLSIDGQEDPDALKNQMRLPVRSVTPNYFAALGLTVIEGRAFRETDKDGAPRVAMVNQAFLDRYLGGKSPLGRLLYPPRERTNHIEVVGVLANTHTDALTQAAEPELYLPFWQSGAFSKHLVVRTEGDPRALAATIQSELRQIDPTVSVEGIKSLEEIRAESVASRTFAMNLLVGFALAACVLSTVGIYGVLSLTAAARRTEMAIRMAVGAQRRDVLRLILREGMRLAGVGIAIGLLVALILSAGLRTYLFGVSPADPLTLIAMVAVVFGLTLITAWIPARRAARVELNSALRTD